MRINIDGDDLGGEGELIKITRVLWKSHLVLIVVTEGMFFVKQILFLKKIKTQIVVAYLLVSLEALASLFKLLSPISCLQFCLKRNL